MCSQTTVGRRILQLKPALERERQQCLNLTEGGTGGGSNVTFLLQANQCRKTEMRQEKRQNP
ncbi:MAG TPA: hypothetical protein D7I10_06495 [Candidatus Poseidoniales archaeon]|nr:MAG TPA: hypothetical protein D7I10_06495 [Candidatus Poseidoniales archaeon]